MGVYQVFRRAQRAVEEDEEKFQRVVVGVAQLALLVVAALLLGETWRQTVGIALALWVLMPYPTSNVRSEP